MVKISPSILACDFLRIGEEAAAMEKAGADMLHLDIMDGVFVPNISFGPPIIKALRGKSKLYFDTHLMITDPLKYIDAFADAGSDMITFHVESKSDISATIDKIASRGIDSGLVISPKTPPETLFPFLHKVKMVLVMTVEPGFGGQKFMPDMCPKIEKLRKYITGNNLDTDIQVDGGIDTVTAPLAVAAGANVLVAGSSLFGKADYAAAVAELRVACTAKQAV